MKFIKIGQGTRLLIITNKSDKLYSLLNKENNFKHQTAETKIDNHSDNFTPSLKHFDKHVLGFRKSKLA